MEELDDAVGIRNNNKVLRFQNGQPSDHFPELLALDHRIVVDARLLVTVDVAIGQFDPEAAHADSVSAVVGYLTPLQTGHGFRIVNIRVDDAQSVVVVAHQLEPLQDVVVEVDPDGRLQRVKPMI